MPLITTPEGFTSIGSFLPQEKWQDTAATVDAVFLFVQSLPPFQQIRVEIAETNGVFWVPTAQIHADSTPLVIVIPPAPFIHSNRRLSLRLMDIDWEINNWSIEVFSMPLSNPASITVPSNTSATATPTSVSSSATSVSLLAANSSRKGATIWNASTATLYVELGATASATAYTAQLSAGGYYEMPFGYTGQISGIWSAANGSALVRELT